MVKNEMARGRPENSIAGKTKGVLTPIRRVGTIYFANGEGKPKRAIPLWEFRCVCGNIITMNKRSFMKSNHRSCRCFLKQNDTLKRFEIQDLLCIGHTGSGIDFTFDVDDLDKVKEHSWFVDSYSGYVVTTLNGKTTYLHRYIMDYDGDDIIDHINGNRRDNRKCNLRVISRTENTKNLHKTGIAGVISHNDGYDVFLSVRKWFDIC